MSEEGVLMFCTCWREGKTGFPGSHEKEGWGRRERWKGSGYKKNVRIKQQIIQQQKDQGNPTIWKDTAKETENENSNKPAKDKENVLRKEAANVK